MEVKLGVVLGGRGVAFKCPPCLKGINLTIVANLKD